MLVLCDFGVFWGLYMSLKGVQKISLHPALTVSVDWSF